MEKKIIGIGIETSCDETGVALVVNGKTIIENYLFSQEKLHALYGGVVPEIASRNHLIKLPILLDEIMQSLNHSPLKYNIDYVAVTVRPGLVGSLLIGYNAALSISQFFQKPVIPIHHLEAHIYAVFLEHNITPQYPFTAIVISGGNSVLYRLAGLGKLQVMGETLDDAAGEALDKAGKMLGLPYPGGKIIDEKANTFYQQCREKGYSSVFLEKQNPFPIILQKERNNMKHLSFSFSGLKTALLYYLSHHSIKEDVFLESSNAVCYFYLNRIISIIISNIKKAIQLYETPYIIAAGGVCANSFLRRAMQTFNKNVYYPSIPLCTDNGAMVAACGYYYYIENIRGREKVTANRSFDNWL